MSYIKLEHRVLNDARVLDLSPAAFTAHLYAMDYCNEQATDGAIPTKVAHRMMCQLDPVEIADAFKELVDSGLWEATDEGYVCPEFLAYGLDGDEQRAVKAKWAQDKRRQRLHRNGNHALCLPNHCAAKKADSTSAVDSGPPHSTAGVDSVPQQGWTTRPDPTRPDPTPKGSGKGSGARLARDGAGAPPGSAPPGWLSLATTSAPTDNHVRLIAYARGGFGSDAGRAFHQVAEDVLYGLLGDLTEVGERHGCDGGCCAETYSEGNNEIAIHIPAEVEYAWGERITSAFARLVPDSIVIPIARTS